MYETTIKLDYNCANKHAIAYQWSDCFLVFLSYNVTIESNNVEKETEEYECTSGNSYLGTEYFAAPGQKHPLNFGV